MSAIEEIFLGSVATMLFTMHIVQYLQFVDIILTYRIYLEPPLDIEEYDR
jgi:hypothetical protein